MAQPPIEVQSAGGATAAPSSDHLREERQHALRDTVTINRHLLQQTQRVERMLLATADLPSLLEVLLVNLPRHLGFAATELWLYDPEEVLAGLLSNAGLYGRHLQLHDDVFSMQELYDLEPEAELLPATDTRMFHVLKTEDSVESALLLPLLDSGRMMGSLHCGIAEPGFPLGAAELACIAHLASVISLCFKNAVSRQQVSRLTMIDPLTQISNLRGFEKDIAREIARARRADLPISVMMLEIDEFDDLYQNYGEVTGQFLVKKVCERISSDLRTSDCLARLDGARLAILVPGSGEVVTGEIAERIRRDIEGFAIDDGRGANLQVTLSIGFVCWEAQRFPAVDMVQLARQVEATADKALAAARAKGGNQTVVSRLSTLMV